jgi:hypothetical protein
VRLAVLFLLASFIFAGVVTYCATQDDARVQALLERARAEAAWAHLHPGGKR